MTNYPMMRFSMLLLGGMLLGWLAMCLPAAGQEPDGAGLSFQASLLKDTIEAGEPAVINLTIRNLGDKATMFTAAMSANGDMKINIERPRRLPHEFLGVETSGVSPDVSSYLRPGDARYYYIPLVFDREADSGYLFTEPQTVTIHLLIKYAFQSPIKDKVWRSAPLTLHVVETSELSKPAVDILHNKSGAIALQTMQLTDESLVNFRKALDVTPKESALHPWLLAALARAYGLSRRQDADMMIGLDYANQLSSQHPASHLADDAIMLQAVIQDLLGMEAEARKSLIQLYNTYSQSEYISEGNPLFIKYFNFNPTVDPATVTTDPTWMFRR